MTDSLLLLFLQSNLGHVISIQSKGYPKATRKFGWSPPISVSKPENMAHKSTRDTMEEQYSFDSL